MLDVLPSIHRYSHSAIISGVLMTVLTTVVVILRLLGRLVTKASFGADDWFIIAAQALWYPQFGVQLWGAIEGRKVTSMMGPQIFTRVFRGLKVIRPSLSMPNSIFRFVLVTGIIRIVVSVEPGVQTKFSGEMLDYAKISSDKLIRQGSNSAGGITAQYTVDVV
ncbi:hypothetical protein NHQ30_007673 [Ciborinia camelliae]|nr:hypothetical protein NHQ30_007673 [Ciborinia camelliae]